MYLSIVTIILSLFSLTCFAQDPYTIRYSCYQTFKAAPGKLPSGANNGTWSLSAPINYKVDFNVGLNKNLDITLDGQKLTFVRYGEPFVSETSNGMKYQVITARYAGAEYIFQYFENYNLRFITKGYKNMIEYSCVKPFNPNAGVNYINYKINIKRSYFYKQPDLKYKSSAFLIYGQVVEALADENGFIFATFVNGNDVKTSGWLLKSDLVRY